MEFPGFPSIHERVIAKSLNRTRAATGRLCFGSVTSRKPSMEYCGHLFLYRIHVAWLSNVECVKVWGQNNVLACEECRLNFGRFDRTILHSIGHYSCPKLERIFKALSSSFPVGDAFVGDDLMCAKWPRQPHRDGVQQRSGGRGNT